MTTASQHPQVAEALRQLRQIQSVLEGQVNRTNSETFTGTDEAKSVEAILNGKRWLTSLRIEDGLLRLGAETVKQRVNEALRNAKAAATAADDAAQEQLTASLVGITGSLKETLGLT